MTTKVRKFRNSLPRCTKGMVVKCPTKNPDGSAIPDDDPVGPGCGSANVGWDGQEMYDCYECGIFFADCAADPPHRRQQGSDFKWRRVLKTIVIQPDGTTAEQALTFEECQEAVGGCVQLLPLAQGVWAYVNEDGKVEGLPDNPTATALCRLAGPNIAADDFIVGPMVVVGVNGNRDITDKARRLVEAAVALYKGSSQGATT